MKNKTAVLISIAFLIWSGSGVYRNLDNPSGKIFSFSVIGVLFFSYLVLMTFADSLNKNKKE
ncbi:hypothetical protein [Chryseobacterium sp.]|uniref:hypothetical protein n=1 Tax=Chryseobacterium sp. TaxID=1871047 RepID=UPI00289A5C60|nr:hypothetical protein [Chryseobacterium sp.]